jgi:hypothetical protein
MAQVPIATGDTRNGVPAMAEYSVSIWSASA